jgi:DNA-binding NarL/FixJ family response regulator
MRIALCCKESLFSEALASLLDRQGAYDVVASESNAQSLIASARENHGQVLIIDSERLDDSELQFVLGAKAFADFVVVLLVRDGDQARYAGQPIERIVSRDEGSTKLFEALSDLGGRVKHYARPIVREGRKPYGKEDNSLSRREYEVALLVAKGMSNRRISHVTGLREQSIKNLVSVVMRKLHCENRVQVALKLVNAQVDDGE